jgi:hypothetical protein
MKLRWLILIGAGAIVIAAWAAVAIAYFFFEPSLPVWATLVTIGALSLEGFLWVAAGVLGWTVFAGRRAALSRLKARLFGSKQAPAQPE